MKKIIILSFLILLIPMVVLAFKPATLFKGLSRIKVTTPQEASNGFKNGYKLETKKVGSAIPIVPSLFETSLASPIGVSDSSMTLVKGTDRSGNTISGYVCYTVDGGSSAVEYMCGTQAGTAVTGMTRGIDPITGTTMVTALKQTHRRGASVKITDFPVLTILARIINGNDLFPNKLTYDPSLSFTGSDASNTIMSKKYIDNGFNQGAATGTESTAGIWRGATKTQMASSTNTFGSYNLLLQSQYATSTSRMAQNSVVITGNDGKIDPSFLNGTENYTFNGITTHNGTTTMATTTFNAFPTTPNAYPTASTSVDNKGYVDNTILNAHTESASDNARYNNGTLRSTDSASYVKLKEIVLNQSIASCRVKFTLDGTGATVYGRVYKNDGAIGTERSNTGGSTQYSEDFTGFVSGDKIQVWGKQNGFQTTNISNLILAYDWIWVASSTNATITGGY